MIKIKNIQVSILVLFLFSIFIVSSQEKPLFNFNTPIDTLYRKQLFDYFQIKTDINADVLSFEINDGKDRGLVISPNERYLFRLSVDYKFLGFSIDFTPAFLPGNKDENLKGNTKYSRLGTRFNFGRTYNELTYTKVKGYYFYDYDVNQYVLLPGYRTTNFLIKTNYIFGDKYSLRSVKAQTEKQLKSTGTFIPTLRFNYIKHDLSQVDAFLLSENAPKEKKKIDLIATFGYHHLWVFNKDFFFGAAIDPGVGVSFKNSKEGTNKLKADLILNLGAKLNLGYNTKRFFTGLEYNYEEAYFSDDNFILQRNRNDFQIYVGYRFDMPKRIRKPFEWIERKTGF